MGEGTESFFLLFQSRMLAGTGTLALLRDVIMSERVSTLAGQEMDHMARCCGQSARWYRIKAVDGYREQ